MFPLVKRPGWADVNGDLSETEVLRRSIAYNEECARRGGRPLTWEESRARWATRFPDLARLMKEERGRENLADGVEP